MGNLSANLERVPLWNSSRDFAHYGRLGPRGLILEIQWPRAAALPRNLPIDIVATLKLDLCTSPAQAVQYSLSKNRSVPSSGAAGYSPKPTFLSLSLSQEELIAQSSHYLKQKLLSYFYKSEQFFRVDTMRRFQFPRARPWHPSTVSNLLLKMTFLALGTVLGGKGVEDLWYHHAPCQPEILLAPRQPGFSPDTCQGQYGSYSFLGVQAPSWYHLTLSIADVDGGQSNYRWVFQGQVKGIFESQF
ncbi:hypothetical protein MRS44_008661 [Fusarium solani]|uniref:uncharacterized protein n=1 Tax=Fusarium solani TaxID=169388 RepID=UPI0032C47405|nr:hypothetical protein MRS44_008661 [Fusarium solani]